MPRVPVYDVGAGVRTRAIPNARFSTTGDQQAFGVGVARALTGAGNVISQRALEIQIEDDESRAKELDIEYSQRLRDLLHDRDSGYYTTKGKEAYMGHARVQGEINKVRERIRALATNDRQKRMFDRVSLARAERALDGAARYAGQERRAWQTGLADARAREQVDYAIDNRTDPGAVRQAIRTGKDEVHRQAELAGWDDQQTQHALEKYETSIHVSVVESFLDTNDVGSAQKYFKENSKYIDASVRGQLEGRLSKQVLTAEAQRLTGQIADTGEPLEVQLRAARTIADNDPSKADLQDEVVKRLKIRFAESETMRKDAERRRTEDFWRRFEDRPNIDSIPGDLPFSVRQAAETYARVRAGGGHIQTNQNIWYELMRMATSNDAAEQKEFSDLELYGYRDQLSNSDFQQLATLQGRLRTNGNIEKETAEFRTTKQMTDDVLRSIGLTPSKSMSKDDANKVVKFRARVDEEIRRRGITTTDPQWRQKVQQAIDDVTQTVYQVRDHWFDKELRAFELDIEGVPSEYIDEIATDLKAKGQEVTDRNIKRVYEGAVKKGLVQ